MRYLIISLMMISCMCMHADDMMHLLRGGYDAKTMSVEEMDSVLAGEDGTVKSGRYRLG